MSSRRRACSARARSCDCLSASIAAGLSRCWSLEHSLDFDGKSYLMLKHCAWTPPCHLCGATLEVQLVLGSPFQKPSMKTHYWQCLELTDSALGRQRRVIELLSVISPQCLRMCGLAYFCCAYARFCFVSGSIKCRRIFHVLAELIYLGIMLHITSQFRHISVFVCSAISLRCRAIFHLKFQLRRFHGAFMLFRASHKGSSISSTFSRPAFSGIFLWLSLHYPGVLGPRPQ